MQSIALLLHRFAERIVRRQGKFDDEVEAAHAYNEAAREHFSADARVNFLRPGELPTALDPNHPHDPHPPPAASATPTPSGRATPNRRTA